MNRMGGCFDRLRCEVFQNLILSPINTGTLRHAVATVLTVYGIETDRDLALLRSSHVMVATVLTVYGIETALGDPGKMFGIKRCNSAYRLRY